MRSARPFLPRCITLLMKRETSSLLNRGSGAGTRRSTLPRLGIVSSEGERQEARGERRPPRPAGPARRGLPATAPLLRRGTALGRLGSVLGPPLPTVLDAAGV